MEKQKAGHHGAVLGRPLKPSLQSSRKEKGEKLLAVDGGRGGLWDHFEIADQRMGLIYGIVLEKGDEKEIFAPIKGGEIFKIARQAVVCGKADEQGCAVSQMGLGGQSQRGVGDAQAQLGKGVACAGGDDHQIGLQNRPHRLGLWKGPNHFSPADFFCPTDFFLRPAKAGVGGGKMKGADGHKIVAQLL